MNVKNLYSVIVLLVTLSACAALPLAIQGQTPPPLDKAFSAKNITNHKLVALDQKIVLEFQDEKTTWFTHMELTGHKLALISFGRLGNELFSTTLDKGELSYKGRLKIIAPKRLLSDLQLAYWPQNKLRFVKAAGYDIKTRAGKRIISYHGAPYALVTFEGDKRWNRKIMIENKSAGYRLTIVPLHVEFSS